MPSLYSSVADFQATPLGVQLNPFTQGLSGGTVTRMLVEASDAVDSYTRRKLGAPVLGNTLAATATNANTITVANGVNIHERDVCVFADGTTVEVLGAELVMTNDEPPYPGTVTLASPVSYSSGSAVTFYRQDQVVARGKSTDAMDQDVAMSQQGQIALAHAPKLGLSTFARKLQVQDWPLWSIYAAYQTLPWTGSPAEIKADMSNITVMRAGYVKFPIGMPNFLGSIWRVQYAAGFYAIPHDVRDATHLFLADAIARSMNPIGALEIRSEGQMARITRQSQTAGTEVPQSFFVEGARSKLQRYRRKSP